MATHKSAMKRIRQTAQRRTRNRATRSQLKTEVKKLRTLVKEGNKDESQKQLPEIVSLIDKTLKKGCIHANRASRYKSRLTNLVNGLSASSK
ncbi:30S ribosomal protein S20 [Acidobacteriota bacterium]